MQACGKVIWRGHYGRLLFFYVMGHAGWLHGWTLRSMGFSVCVGLGIGEARVVRGCAGTSGGILGVPVVTVHCDERIIGRSNPG
jgi:hypothetical protein